MARRNIVCKKISDMMKKPALTGHLGEYIAKNIFEIELHTRANQKGSDGKFKKGTLSNKTVDIKFYPIRENVLDLKPPDKLEGEADYYLVFTGPKSTSNSCKGTTRPWIIENVFLFKTTQLKEELRGRNRTLKIGTATSVRECFWKEAEIFPEQTNTRLILSQKQKEELWLFSKERLGSLTVEDTDREEFLAIAKKRRTSGNFLDFEEALK